MVMVKYTTNGIVKHVSINLNILSPLYYTDNTQHDCQVYQVSYSSHLIDFFIVFSTSLPNLAKLSISCCFILPIALHKLGISFS
jgi:hypothetical protein